VSTDAGSSPDGQPIGSPPGRTALDFAGSLEQARAQRREADVPSTEGRDPAGSGESGHMSTATMSRATSSGHPELLQRLLSGMQHMAGWLGRPRVRLVTVGIVLLLIGALIVTSSVWTLPLVILGAVMVLIAWVGSRLDGHFAIEWGERGTELQFRARIRPAPAPARPALSAGAVRSAAASATAPSAGSPPVAHEDVVEGEAHTVEIDVAELKALIAAAEAEQAERDVAKAALRLVDERDAAG
jgi:hypothetical protein